VVVLSGFDPKNGLGTLGGKIFAYYTQMSFLDSPNLVLNSLYVTKNKGPSIYCHVVREFCLVCRDPILITKLESKEMKLNP